MTLSSVVPATAALQRIRLTHHLLELQDGHRVGVSVGGAGVPLVFMHGLALSRRAYVRMLSRVAGLGFLVVAIDAAGHGDTHNLPRQAADLADRVDLTVRTLDALGVRQAVFAGTRWADAWRSSSPRSSRSVSWRPCFSTPRPARASTKSFRGC